jgi:Ca2+/Na+ antiporter
MLLGFPTSIVFLGAAFTGNHNLLGFLIGYATGILNIQWLHKNSKKVIENEQRVALRHYYLNFASRLGMITLVTVMLYVFRPQWLYLFAYGIALAILIAVVLMIRQEKNERE